MRTHYVAKLASGDIAPNVLEISEDWAWIEILQLKKLPSQLTDKDRAEIARPRESGLRVIPVQLNEHPSGAEGE